MLSDFSGSKVYLACGYTDLRRGIDGLATIVEQQFKLDPCSDALFLFCGQRKGRQRPRATCDCTEQADAARRRSFSMTTDRTARRRTLKNISKTSRDIYIPTATKRIEVLMTSRSSAVGRTPEEDSVKRWRFYRKSSARIRRQLSVWITAVSCMRSKRK